jgi:pilus assembly protein CpaF
VPEPLVRDPVVVVARQLAVKLDLAGDGRQVDMSTPFVAAMMPDGSRLHVVIPAITA